MRVSLFDYELPDELIAQRPAAEREGARLLAVGLEDLLHTHVGDLPALLPPDALVVVNDTRVRRARLIGAKSSGGRVEVFLLEQTGATWSAMTRSSKPLKFPLEVRIEGAPLRAKLLRRRADGLVEVELTSDEGTVEDAIERFGRVPLPPYVKRDPDAADEARYQTVYASKPGAVAAPTAGLHLSEALLAEIARERTIARVTLHVGLGTFAPVTAEDLDDHPMHSERYEIPEETLALVASAKNEGRAIVAIGTTVVRALESFAASGKSSGETRLLIQPGFSFRLIDVLFTNFHLPRSTLLALVCAFGGRARVLAAYEAAVAARYRFFSYGDAMLIARAP